MILKIIQNVVKLLWASLAPFNEIYFILWHLNGGRNLLERYGVSTTIQ